MPEKKIPQKFNPLPRELKKLGLNQNEAEIYLFLLEKKQSTALSISRELSLSRPTVYRIIEKLKQKNLIFAENENQNKKQFFSANSPDEFLKFLRIQKKKAEEQEREFLRIISILHEKYGAIRKNEIKLFQVKTALEDFASTREKNIFIFLTKENTLNHKKIADLVKNIQKRQGEISVKIFSDKEFSHKKDFIENRIIDFQANNFFSSLLVADKIFVIKNKKAFCLEEENFVAVIKLFLNILWGKK